ncbi:MAG: recombinase family protein [Chloroflexi bacterium]|nr:recombinase family protein [Chloroflexota bacterium]
MVSTPRNRLAQVNGVAKRLRACAYIRVSDPRQVKFGASLEEQKASIVAYCEHNNIEMAHIYVDAGISARKINRPGFNEMLEDVKAGKYNLVIVWKLDRMSRRPITGYRLKEAMDATRTEFYSIVEGDTVNNRVAFGMWLSFAEQESIDKSVRAKVGAAGRAKKGQIYHDAKYGYRMGADGKPEIYEPEAEVVRRVFREYIEGVGTYEIGKRLEREGILPRRRSFWPPYAILHIIKAIEYTGVGYFGRVRRVSIGDDHIRTEITDPSEWIQISYPTIIDEETWQAAQELRKARGRGFAPRRDPLEYPLRGLLYCACGHKYTVQTTAPSEKPGRKKSQRSYACIIGRYRKDRGCARRYIGAVGLEAAVWERVKWYFKHPEDIMAGLALAREEHESTGTLDELERKRCAMEAIEEERKRHVINNGKGYLTDEELDLLMKGIMERREAYQAEIDRLESQIADYEAHMANIEEFTEKARQMAQDIDDWTEEERAEAIQKFIKKVVVKGNTGDWAHDLDIHGHLDKYLTNAMQACLRAT